MVEVSGPTQLERLEELRAYASGGPAVSRVACDWAVDRIEELQDLLATALGDRIEPLPEAATPHWCRCVLDVVGETNHRRYVYVSDFARLVVELALKCDAENLGLLARSFPEAVASVQLWRARPDDARRLAEERS